MTTRPFELALVLVLSLVASPSPADSQTEVALEVGASHVGPAIGRDADEARYAMGGIRASHWAASGGGLFASFLGGRALGDSTGGRFLSALVEASAIDGWSERWSGALGVTLLGFEVRAPFPYRTVAVEVAPSARYRTARVDLEVGVLGGLGRSRIELWRRAGGLSRVFEDDHWRAGATAELLVGSPTVRGGVAAGTHRSAGERYHTLGTRLLVGGGWGVVELRADRWDTPLGFETTGGISVALPLTGGWRFRGFFGRSDPDPLTLAQPGSGSGGALVGWTAYSTASTAREPLYEVLRGSAESSRIRIALRAPQGARRVAVLGDFTLWDAVPMRQEGDLWVAELDVGVGAHHFGFLVDEEWYLPDDAPDVVPDEWGRASATLVIEGAGR